ncbi:MAG: ATP-binding protein [Crocosphaera sp.]|nr:ATP-binding protein [Crocosphaera sp.]
MNEADRIWDELENIYSQWGIEENPFSESASNLGVSRLREVFTGRSRELKDVLSLFKGRERKRVLVYGWIGIGKTAFILEILDILQRKAAKTLTAYISLPANTDLATIALVALAREMREDEWAQQLLNQMGLISGQPLRQREITGKVGFAGSSAEFKDKRIDINKPLFPELSFEDLLKRALEKYDRVVIAIDDLDKQDPATVKKLLLNAQGMLKSGAWFILTGHPSGLTRDIVISERGLFDFSIKLEPLEQNIMYQMLVNYLNSVRSEECQYSVEDEQAVKPFTPDTAKMLCERSSGVPRWLNRLGSYILQKASELNAEIITPEILQEGFIYANQQVRGQLGLTPMDFMLLDLILEKGKLSDENITLEELQRLQVQEFSEILPRIDQLIQLDLTRRLPNEEAMEFGPTPLLLPSEESET